jgi:hypothetical protein
VITVCRISCDADTSYFGPEAEFFIFDDVRFAQVQHSASYQVDSIEGSWNSPFWKMLLGSKSHGRARALLARAQDVVVPTTPVQDRFGPARCPEHVPPDHTCMKRYGAPQRPQWQTCGHGPNDLRIPFARSSGNR